MLEKLISLEKLQFICETLKENNKKIIFTNGCFDLLHVGHLRSLKAAKELGDILIVAINDDQSVQLLKGPNRPLAPDYERAELLAGFACVDYVTIFSGKTVADVLLQLKPHVHAKGTDYTADSVPEKKIVQSYGGNIAITGDPKNHSSTEIIKRLRTITDDEEQKK